ncbi:MAG: hypothetical protein EXR21_00405 [Flavobacteriaceae bacterium]|nr:hypothetical protein [Flavobacteriaceae bacterium]
MDTFLEILKFTIPSAVLGLIVWLILDRFMQAEESRRNLELRIKNQGLLTPLRLQAYERLTLFLERISPQNILPRISKPGMSAAELQHQVIAEINAEYSHNLSQQIYVSHQVWMLTRAVKEQVVNLVNISYTRLPENARSIDLSKMIFAFLIEQNENPTQKALDFLCKEVHLIFSNEG